MGGAIAVHIAAQQQLPTLCGLAVIDVVEGVFNSLNMLIHASLFI